MLKITQSGNFDNIERFLKRGHNREYLKCLYDLAEIGVRALRDGTPKDTGVTANSWTYTITKNSNLVEIAWYNTNRPNGYDVAIGLQYGHATGWGSYVKGRDYINPAMRPAFKEIEESMWKEVID